MVRTDAAEAHVSPSKTGRNQPPDIGDALARSLCQGIVASSCDRQRGFRESGWCRSARVDGRQWATGQVRMGISVIPLNQTLFMGVQSPASSMSGSWV